MRFILRKEEKVLFSGLKKKKKNIKLNWDVVQNSFSSLSGSY